MKNSFISIIVLLFLAIASCSSTEQDVDGTKTISDSTTATKSEDGTIKFTEPSKKAKESLHHFSMKLEEVNAKHPKPTVDFKKNRAFEKVDTVLQNGTLRLENGKVVGFAGCDCDDTFTEHLRRTFTDVSSQVYFLDTGYIYNNILYAYVWEVDVDFGEGIGTKYFPVGPSFTLLNEVAIINKWCRPIIQQGHLYHDRYISLSKIVRSF